MPGYSYSVCKRKGRWECLQKFRSKVEKLSNNEQQGVEQQQKMEELSNDKQEEEINELSNNE
ncbi:hypothetical protein C1645_837638 [Glomus cerebriforme]|uniref:Uncharacterized protein n=1 Tax=Glomus cerebriforme TaxID=658196 RepID=A0A397SE64_9GLOM|nr:hypothetical protein C1645_837638 [Glomus cerebriforme]